MALTLVRRGGAHGSSWLEKPCASAVKHVIVARAASWRKREPVLAQPAPAHFFNVDRPEGTAENRAW